MVVASTIVIWTKAIATLRIIVPLTIVHGSFVHVFYRLAKTVCSIDITLLAEQHDTLIILRCVNAVDITVLLVLILLMMVVMMKILVQFLLLQFINSDMLELSTLLVHNYKLG